MKIFLIALFFSISCHSQTHLQFDEVRGNDIATCDELSNGKICQSKSQFEIWLTRASSLFGRFETINLVFDGNGWKAKHFVKDFMRNETDSNNLKPLYNYDTIFSSLKKNRVFILPDQKELTLESSVDDGYDYFLAFKAGNKFRKYEFSNPEAYLEQNKNVLELENYVNIINILFNWLRHE